MTGYANGQPVPRSQPHHYVFHTSYCPVCGSERTERTRMAGPKPTDPDPVRDYQLTHHFEEHYDWCDAL